MERDFMGLTSKIVKVEMEACPEEDAGFARSSRFPWQFSNKAPSFSSLKLDRDEKQNYGHNFLGKPSGVSSTSGTGAGDQWVINKASELPAQLTVFYGGDVCVFDGITPEKAKEIMCLAEKYCTPSTCFEKPKLTGGSGAGHILNSGHARPISVSSHPTNVANPAAGNDDELVKVETPKIKPPSAIMSSAIPQARKASLARFLEKRKERVMCSSPYVMNK